MKSAQGLPALSVGTMSETRWIVEGGVIVDPHHTSLPYLTKYEYTRSIGIRATQIEQGAALCIETDSIDSYWIAKEEVHQKKVPFIFKRPLPNGPIEYWKLEDLEILF